jgi:hypothetical protein
MGMNDPVRVKLSEADLAGRAVSIAQAFGVVEALRAKKAADAKSTQAQIDNQLDNIASMCRVVLEAEENAKQGDLFVDGTLGQVGGELAKRCTCEGGIEAEVKAVDCPIHGMGAAAAVEALAAVADPAAVEELAADLEAGGIGEPVDVGTVNEPAANAAGAA